MVLRRLLTALLVALAVSSLFTFWLSRRIARPHAAATVARPQYVATDRALTAGDMLTAANLKLAEWSGPQPLQGASAHIEDVAGRIVLYPIAAGQPILPSQLAAPGEAAGLAYKIPTGMRALSLKSNEVTGVSGFLLPATHVDVLVTYKHAKDGESATTATILQDATVLAAGQKLQPDPEGKPTTVDVVTLLVTPADAERVVLANSLGEVHFVLRNGADREQPRRATLGQAELEGVPAPHATSTITPARGPQPAHTAAAAPYQVQTVAGNKQTVESFQ